MKTSWYFVYSSNLKPVFAHWDTWHGIGGARDLGSSPLLLSPCCPALLIELRGWHIKFKSKHSSKFLVSHAKCDSKVHRPFCLTGTVALCATWTTSPVSMECCPRENQRKNPLRYNVITSLSLSTLSIFRGIFWISVMIKCHSQDPCQSLMSIIATNSMHSNVIFTNLIPQTKKLLLYNSPRIIFPL